MTNNRLIFKVLFYLTAAVISVLSMVSLNVNRTESIGGVAFRLDYIFHFGAYFCMALFLMSWKCKKKLDKKLFLLILFFGILSSSIFEFIQLYLPNRVFNPLDLVFNLFGYNLGMVLFFMGKRKVLERVL